MYAVPLLIFADMNLILGISLLVWSAFFSLGMILDFHFLA